MQSPFLVCQWSVYDLPKTILSNEAFYLFVMQKHHLLQNLRVKDEKFCENEKTQVSLWTT
jgi:hypothetical protein